MALKQVEKILTVTALRDLLARDGTKKVQEGVYRTSKGITIVVLANDGKNVKVRITGGDCGC